jgi:hypothetical protein
LDHGVTQLFVFDLRNDPRLLELDKRMEELTKKLGLDYSGIAGSNLDEEGEAIFAGLDSTCPSST